jgi:UDP-N-acetylglucosamine acyltransferase
VNVDIHPTAVVHPDASLGEGVVVGAYAFVGPFVSLGRATVVDHHATVDGHTTLGSFNHVHPYAFVGAQTHDLKYKNGTTWLKIGDHNVFREYSSVHTATGDGDATLVGDHNYFLAFAHLGHDCHVGNKVIVSAGAAVGGHVFIGDHANVGGNSSIHQFCRMGSHSMLGAHSFLKKDLLPFMLAIGVPATVRSFNKIGMERHGFSSEQREFVKHTFKCFYHENNNRSQALAVLRQSMISDPRTDSLAATIDTFARDSIRGLI